MALWRYGAIGDRIQSAGVSVGAGESRRGSFCDVCVKLLQVSSYSYSKIWSLDSSAHSAHNPSIIIMCIFMPSIHKCTDTRIQKLHKRILYV
jgi:hypothetical protein